VLGCLPVAAAGVWLLLLDEAGCAEGVCKVSGQVGYGLRPVKVSELLKLLASDGWVLKRTRGSHRQFVHPTKPGKVTVVAGKPSDTIKPKTEASILRQAGLKNSDELVEGTGEEGAS